MNPLAYVCRSSLRYSSLLALAVSLLGCGDDSAPGGGGVGGGAGVGGGGDGGGGAAGVGGAGAGGGPVECSSGCPEGYACSELGICEGGDPLHLVLAVPTVRVSGVVTHNGQMPATGPECGGCPECTKAGVVFTDDLGSTFSASIPCSAGYSFALDVPVGTYEVAVTAQGQDYTGLPPYGHAVVNSSFSVTGAASNLVFDVPTVPVNGSVRHNGQMPATGPECGGCPECTKAGVVFTDAGGSNFSASIPCSSAYGFSLDVPPGTYSVAVTAQGDDYTGLPPYGHAVVNPSLSVTGALSNLVLDVPTVPIIGVVTHNGQPPATGPECGGCPECTKAGVVFTDAGGSSFSASIPCASAYGFDLDLPPGTYSVAVTAQGNDYTGLPPYGHAVVNPSLAVTGAVSNLVLDVSTVPVGGAITHNGQLPATGPECGGCPECTKAGVLFTDAGGSSFSASIPCSSPYAFDLDLPPGTYQVAVTAQGEDYTGLPPYGHAVVNPSLSVTGALSNLVLDLPTVAVGGIITHNGQLPATGPECGGCPDCTKAGVLFTDAAGSSFSASIPCSAAYSFGLDMLPGDYTVAVTAQGDDYTGLPPYGNAVVVQLLAIP